MNSIDSPFAAPFSYGRGVRRLFFLFLISSHLVCQAADTPTTPYFFAPINQLSVTKMAQQWNPILDWVSQKSGVTLVLKIGKDAAATTDLTVQGKADFAFTNHLFSPERQSLGWRVIARLQEPEIHGWLIVRADAPYRSPQDLQHQTVAFPSREAFVGYHVPVKELRQRKIQVQSVFPGNQDGAISLLEKRGVAAAAVADNMARRYLGERLNNEYRVLWESDGYQPLAIMASPRVPEEIARRVAATFVQMKDDPEGAQVLQRCANASTGSIEGFVPANDADYDSYVRFYNRKTP